MSVAMKGLRVLVDRVSRALAEEAAGGLSGLAREGALLTLDETPMVVVGDIHGDMASLKTVLGDSGILRRLGKGWRLLFLGDYADRGPNSLEVYEAVLGLKADHPKDVVLLKGNHEALEMIPIHPHDLPDRLRAAYGREGDEIYSSLLDLHALLPSAAIHGGRTLLIHGGVFPGISRSSLARPTQRELEMMLWNDPYEDSEGVSASPRGAGVRFGPAVTVEALSTLGLKQIVRSHSAVQKGYRFSHGGRVLTIFSAKRVYGLDGGAYLVLEGGHPLGDCIRAF